MISNNEQQQKRGGAKGAATASTARSEGGGSGGGGGGVWPLSSGGAVAVSVDVGHFALDFDAHSERLEVFNLGTDWVEMTGSVPIDSPYSAFHSVIDHSAAIDPKYKAIDDVAIGYLFQTVGR